MERTIHSRVKTKNIAVKLPDNSATGAIGCLCGALARRFGNAQERGATAGPRRRRVRPLSLFAAEDDAITAGVAIEASSHRDHSHQNAILAHDMMIKRCTDVRRDKSRDGQADQPVQLKKLLREDAVLRGYDR